MQPPKVCACLPSMREHFHPTIHRPQFAIMAIYADDHDDRHYWVINKKWEPYCCAIVPRVLALFVAWRGSLSVVFQLNLRMRIFAPAPIVPSASSTRYAVSTQVKNEKIMLLCINFQFRYGGACEVGANYLRSVLDNTESEHSIKGGFRVVSASNSFIHQWMLEPPLNLDRC